MILLPVIICGQALIIWEKQTGRSVQQAVVVWIRVDLKKMHSIFIKVYGIRMKNLHICAHIGT